MLQEISWIIKGTFIGLALIVFGILITERSVRLKRRRTLKLCIIGFSLLFLTFLVAIVFEFITDGKFEYKHMIITLPHPVLIRTEIPLRAPLLWPVSILFLVRLMKTLRHKSGIVRSKNSQETLTRKRISDHIYFPELCTIAIAILSYKMFFTNLNHPELNFLLLMGLMLHLVFKLRLETWMNSQPKKLKSYLENFGGCFILICVCFS